MLRPLVGVWFQELFHSPNRSAFHLSLTATNFTIGLTGVFSLTGWTRQIHAELLVFRATQDDTTPHHASDTGLSPATVVLSRTFSSQSEYDNVVLQPPRRIATSWVWAVPRSLATTGGIIKLFSFPAGTKMFQFPALAS